MKLISAFKHTVISKRPRLAEACSRRITHTPLTLLSTADALHAPSIHPKFEELGLHPPIVTALRRAFPDVVCPTEAQTKFIPAVLTGKDVLLKDFPGSGKSFGLAIALLNKPRLRSKALKAGKDCEFHHITSLVIVPHRDLAYQYLHWIERIVACAAVEPSPELKSVAQILVRDGGAHVAEGLASVRETSPHILIGTPQALMDVWLKDQNALQLSRLSTVVVDEADYLIQTLPRKDPNKSFRPAVTNAAKKLLAHPGATRELLDVIYHKRKELRETQMDESGMVRRSGLNDETTTTSFPLPQLVMCSATLRGHLRTYLFRESGWLNKDNLMVFKGTTKLGPTLQEQQGKSKNIDVIGESKVTHSILIVSEDGVVNVEGADPPPHSETGHDPVTPEVIFGTATVPGHPNLDTNVAEKYATTPSPFNPNALEAIATAFALDVPSIALLVLPASAPVQRAVYELREMGLNAHGLDLLQDGKGKEFLLHKASKFQENPTLLVSTLATTRGVDLPELSHVFILGIPEGPKVTARAVDAYLHVAGRVGRFGRGGRVITLVEKSSGRVGAAEGGGEAGKMIRILKTIEVTPVRFGGFDWKNVGTRPGMAEELMLQE